MTQQEGMSEEFVHCYWTKTEAGKTKTDEYWTRVLVLLFIAAAGYSEGVLGNCGYGGMGGETDVLRRLDGNKTTRFLLQ